MGGLYNLSVQLKQDYRDCKDRMSIGDKESIKKCLNNIEDSKFIIDKNLSELAREHRNIEEEISYIQKILSDYEPYWREENQYLHMAGEKQ